MRFLFLFSITISFYIQDKLNDFDNEQLKNETSLGVQNDLKTDKAFFLMTSDYLYKRVKLIRTHKMEKYHRKG